MIKSLSGWANATIGDVAEVSTGSTPKRTESKYWENADIPWLTSSVTGKPICKSATQFVSSLAVKECRLKTFSKGTLLLAMYGEGKTRGQVTEIKIDATCNQACAAIAVDSQLASKEFVKYRLLENYQATRLAAAGGNQPNLNLNKVRAIITPLAPLKEQKRIVEKLDSLLTQVDTIQKRLNNLPDIIKRFRQSVLAAAVSGKLTEQWREENKPELSDDEFHDQVENYRYDTWVEEKLRKYDEKGKLPKTDAWKKKYVAPVMPETDIKALPNGWVSEVLEGLVYISARIGWKGLKASEYTEEGPLFLSVHGLNYGQYVNLDKAFHISEERYLESPEIMLKNGDILLCKDGAGIGKIGIVQGLEECASINSSLLLIRSGKFFNTKFLFYFLSGPTMQALVHERMTGSAVPHLFQRDVKEFVLSVPPMKEQIEIVRLVEQYFALADTLEKNLANAKQRVDNLTQSILAKAFRGELVPQDPNDEPADKLLARIKAARLEAEKLEKTAKKAAKASKK